MDFYKMLQESLSKIEAERAEERLARILAEGPQVGELVDVQQTTWGGPVWNGHVRKVNVVDGNIDTITVEFRHERNRHISDSTSKGVLFTHDIKWSKFRKAPWGWNTEI